MNVFVALIVEVLMSAAVLGYETEISPKLDPIYASCAHAKANGYGPYTKIDPEYKFYDDRDHDGQVCE